MDYDEVLHARGVAQHCKRHVPVTLTVGSVPCTRQVQLQAWEGAISIITQLFPSPVPCATGHAEGICLKRTWFALTQNLFSAMAVG